MKSPADSGGTSILHPMRREASRSHATHVGTAAFGCLTRACSAGAPARESPESKSKVSQRIKAQVKYDCAGGASDNSPALQRRGTRQKRTRPRGTPEPSNRLIVPEPNTAQST